MKELEIYKAQPTTRHHEPIPDVVIRIGPMQCPQPSTFNNVALDASTFEADAIALAHALRSSLPGGTLDRLVIELLKAKASSLVVPAL